MLVDGAVVGLVTGLAVAAVAVAGSVPGGRSVGRISHDPLRKAFGWLVTGMAGFVLTQVAYSS